MNMTFDEVMEQVKNKGNRNQEDFKKCIYYNEYGSIKMIMLTSRECRGKFLPITAEQFLKIYEILGE